MQVKLRLYVQEEECTNSTIEIEDRKLEELSEEEKEQVIDIYVRQWADQHLRIAWETETEEH